MAFVFFLIFFFCYLRRPCVQLDCSSPNVMTTEDAQLMEAISLSLDSPTNIVHNACVAVGQAHNSEWIFPPPQAIDSNGPCGWHSFGLFSFLRSGGVFDNFVPIKTHVEGCLKKGAREAMQQHEKDTRSRQFKSFVNKPAVEFCGHSRQLLASNPL